MLLNNLKATSVLFLFLLAPLVFAWELPIKYGFKEYKIQSQEDTMALTAEDIDIKIQQKKCNKEIFNRLKRDLQGIFHGETLTIAPPSAWDGIHKDKILFQRKGKTYESSPQSELGVRLMVLPQEFLKYQLLALKSCKKTR